jgi:hypothetical protein
MKDTEVTELTELLIYAKILHWLQHCIILDQTLSVMAGGFMNSKLLAFIFLGWLIKNYCYTFSNADIIKNMYYISRQILYVQKTLAAHLSDRRIKIGEKFWKTVNHFFS